MESYGGELLANFAWGTDQRWNAEWKSAHYPVSQWSSEWVESFHIWALDWSEEQMTISLDDAVLNTLNLNNVRNGSARCAG